MKQDWPELRAALLSVEADRPLDFLRLVKEWLVHNQLTPEELLGAPTTYGVSTLTKLLSVDISEFLIQNPDELANIQTSLNRTKTFDSVEKVLDYLESQVYRLVTITDDDRCPSCHEGILMYWVASETVDNPTETVFLECDECSKQFYVDGRQAAVLYPVHPPTKADLELIHKTVR